MVCFCFLGVSKVFTKECWALISNYGLGDLASQTQRNGNLSYSLLSRHFQHVGVANGTSITMGIRIFWSILKSQKHIEKSVSLVFAWLVFTFLDSQTFYQLISGLDS